MHKAQNRALACTRVPGKKHHFASIHLEIDIQQGILPAGVAFTDVFESQQGHQRTKVFIWKIGNRMASTMNSTSAPIIRMTPGPSAAMATPMVVSSSRS
ncbi:MAG: hypothetical protein BWZ07_03177 [Alphaproteobacteria bacterium ADurb.BinA280]|nr:MAG: hypothetical protein BWZ07_03177 [Alphaproteobacteria bacterium ADurb.BinA280]